MKVHVLGNGPYAKEVVDQLDRPDWEFEFLGKGDDDADDIGALIIGIANPVIKSEVIREYYAGSKPECFISSVAESAIISKFGNRGIINVGPLSVIGRNTIIDHFVSICARVTIGHDCYIGKYSTICPGAIISGNVFMSRQVFVGAGAVLRDNITIGPGATIGCGAVVVKDVAAGSTVVGNPARELET